MHFWGLLAIFKKSMVHKKILRQVCRFCFVCLSCLVCAMLLTHCMPYPVLSCIFCFALCLVVPKHLSKAMMIVRLWYEWWSAPNPIPCATNSCGKNAQDKKMVSDTVHPPMPWRNTPFEAPPPPLKLAWHGRAPFPQTRIGDAPSTPRLSLGGHPLPLASDPPIPLRDTNVEC